MIYYMIDKNLYFFSLILLCICYCCLILNESFDFKKKNKKYLFEKKII